MKVTTNFSVENNYWQIPNYVMFSLLWELVSYIHLVKPRSPIYCQIEKWEKFVVMSCFSQHNGFWTLKKFLLDVRLVKVSRVLLWCYWERKFLQSCLLYYIYTDQVDVREDGFGFFLCYLFSYLTLESIDFFLRSNNRYIFTVVHVILINEFRVNAMMTINSGEKLQNLS